MLYSPIDLRLELGNRNDSAETLHDNHHFLAPMLIANMVLLWWWLSPHVSKDRAPDLPAETVPLSDLAFRHYRVAPSSRWDLIQAIDYYSER